MSLHRVLMVLLLLAVAGATPSAEAVDGNRAAGAVRPVPGAVVRPFEAPAHAYGPGHRGVDLAAVPGEGVRAALAGTVRFAGTVAGTGWVTLDHGGGLTTTYGPLADGPPAGTEVSAGQWIGRLSDEGTHLDWGARIDPPAVDPPAVHPPAVPPVSTDQVTGRSYIDPMSLLRRWRMRLTDVDRVPTGAPITVAGD